MSLLFFFFYLSGEKKTTHTQKPPRQQNCALKSSRFKGDEKVLCFSRLLTDHEKEERNVKVNAALKRGHVHGEEEIPVPVAKSSGHHLGVHQRSPLHRG